MKYAFALLFGMFLGCLPAVSVIASPGQCTRSIGPPGNFCPRCYEHPNYLWAYKSGTTSCIRCYTGCLIETAAPDGTQSIVPAPEKSRAQCEAAQPFLLSSIDPAQLVALDSDPDKIDVLARRYPAAASLLAVLDTAADPMAMLVAEQEFQVDFRHRPIAATAGDYLSGVEQAGGQARAKLLPQTQDVLVTARTQARADGTVLMTVTSELREAGEPNRVIEGPVAVVLRATGAKKRITTKALGETEIAILGIDVLPR